MQLPARRQQPGSPERLQKPQDGIWRHFQVAQHQESAEALMVRRRQKPCLQQMVPVMDEGANGVFPLLQLIAGVPAEEDSPWSSAKAHHGRKAKEQDEGSGSGTSSAKGQQGKEMGLCLQ